MSQPYRASPPDSLPCSRPARTRIARFSSGLADFPSCRVHPLIGGQNLARMEMTRAKPRIPPCSCDCGVAFAFCVGLCGVGSVEMSAHFLRDRFGLLVDTVAVGFLLRRCALARRWLGRRTQVQRALVAQHRPDVDRARIRRRHRARLRRTHHQKHGTSRYHVHLRHPRIVEIAEALSALTGEPHSLARGHRHPLAPRSVNARRSHAASFVLRTRTHCEFAAVSVSVDVHHRVLTAAAGDQWSVGDAIHRVAPAGYRAGRDDRAR